MAQVAARPVTLELVFTAPNQQNRQQHQSNRFFSFLLLSRFPARHLAGIGAHVKKVR